MVRRPLDGVEVPRPYCSCKDFVSFPYENVVYYVTWSVLRIVEVSKCAFAARFFN